MPPNKPYLQLDSLSSKLKIGVNQVTKKREFETRRFYYTNFELLENSAQVRKNPPDSIFTADNIRPDGLKIAEGTRNTDQYQASHLIDAAYGMLDFNILDRLFLTGGMRMEKSSQKVMTFALHDVNKSADIAELKTTHHLPAYNVTWRFWQKMQLRASYSRTLSRPDFRELSTATYTDDQIDMEVVGYPDLKTSRILNRDIRWEWYPRSKQNLSIGFFQKDIEKPIERVLLNAAGNANIVSFRNSKKAVNKGVEFEFMLHQNFFGIDTTLGGNYSRILSKITLDLAQVEGESTLTSLERPMQGVSPYTSNLYLSLESFSVGHTSTLVYNEIGKRITELGSNGQPDVYERPLRQVDYVSKQKIGKLYHLSFKIKNLLAEGKITEQAGREILRVEGSRTYSIGLSAKI